MKKICTEVKKENVEALEKPSMKQKIANTFRDHAAEIIYGTVIGGITVICVVAGVRQRKANNNFIASAKEKYGPNVTQGCVFGGKPSKLLDMRNEWEEGNGKVNFDNVKNVVKKLDLQPGEIFTVEKLTDKEHLGEVEVFQMLDNGFFNNEYLK